MPRTLVQALGFVLGMWLAIQLIQPLGASGAGPGDPALVGLEDDLHARVNAARGRHHRMALQRDAELDRVARAHSADMAARRYLSHDTPEGVNPVGRLTRGGVEGFSLAGENVGLTSRGDPNAEIVDGWLLSPVHRENLLAPAYNTTGIGIARAADGTLYYTQVYVTVPR